MRFDSWQEEKRIKNSCYLSASGWKSDTAKVMAGAGAMQKDYADCLVNLMQFEN